jgi:hypothetical protein
VNSSDGPEHISGLPRVSGNRESSQHRSHQTFSFSMSSSLDAPSSSQAFGSLKQGCPSWETGTIGTWAHIGERHCSPLINKRSGTPTCCHQLSLDDALRASHLAMIDEIVISGSEVLHCLGISLASALVIACLHAWAGGFSPRLSIQSTACIRRLQWDQEPPTLFQANNVCMTRGAATLFRLLRKTSTQRIVKRAARRPGTVMIC